MKLSIHTTSTASTVRITGSTPAFYNTLRRILLRNIPSLSIDLVRISNNTSTMPNEMLCHRVAMLQLPYARLRSTCSCQMGCRECCISFTLNYTTTEGETRVLKGQDLFSDTIDTSRINGVIAKLGPRQTIKLRGIAKNGDAKIHAKFSAVNVVSFDENADGICGLKVELAEHRRIDEVMEHAFDVFKRKINRLMRALEDIEE